MIGFSKETRRNFDSGWVESFANLLINNVEYGARQKCRTRIWLSEGGNLFLFFDRKLRFDCAANGLGKIRVFKEKASDQWIADIVLNDFPGIRSDQVTDFMTVTIEPPENVVDS